MRLILTLLVSLALVLPAQAQTSLLDDYNRADDNVLGMTPTSPKSLQWSEKDEDAGSEVRVENNTARFTSDGTGGIKSAVVDMSNLDNYPVPINSATSTMTWAFNVRAEHSELTGFDSGKTGVMFMLTGTSNDIDGSANAYAVIIGSPNNATNNDDPIQVVRFNGGYSGNGELNVVTGGRDGNDSDYRSIRVTYDPGTNEWSLYVASNSSGFPYSDPRNVPSSEQVGTTTVDANGPTGDSSAKFLGPHYNHGGDATLDAVFDDVYVSDPGDELPVELTRFDAVQDRQSVRLTWATASETGNAGFAVQQKVDGSFEQQGFVDGAGTTTQSQSYTFTVDDVGPGTHAFRLKQVDTDGTVHYSDVETVSVRPNELMVKATGAQPAASGAPATFRLAAETNQPVTATLHDALGRRVATLHDGPVRGSGVRLTVAADDYSSGMYFLRVSSPTTTQTRRVMIVQ